MTSYFQYSRQKEIHQLQARNDARLEEAVFDDIPAKYFYLYSCFLECFHEKNNKTIFKILNRRYESKKNNLNVLSYIAGALLNFHAAGHGSFDLLKAKNCLSNSSFQSSLDRELLAELIYSDVMDNRASNIAMHQKIVNNYKTLGSISTDEFLELAFFFSINCCELGLKNQIIEDLNKIMEKFEVNGKLHSNYGGEMNKGSGRYDVLYRYFLLSAALLLENKRNENYRYLNAILKLNDLFSEYIAKVKQDDLLLLLTALFVMEERTILHLYDTRQFRLPANQ